MHDVPSFIFNVYTVYVHSTRSGYGYEGKSSDPEHTVAHSAKIICCCCIVFFICICGVMYLFNAVKNLVGTGETRHQNLVKKIVPKTL